MPPFYMVLCPAQVSSMHHGFLQWYVSHRPTSLNESTSMDTMTNQILPCSCIHHQKQIHWLVCHQASCIFWTNVGWHGSNQAYASPHLQYLLHRIESSLHTCTLCIKYAPPHYLPFNLSARGSRESMTRTFQSVSPSSNNAMIPNAFTCLTSPGVPTHEPISHTSIGSLSPRACVSGCVAVGSSQV